MSKRVKRPASLALALILLLALLPGTASAAEVIAGGDCGKDEYALSGNLDTLTWTLDSGGLLTITGSGAMADYLGTDSEYYSDWAPWYPYREKITSVSIGDKVTRIGMNAFCDCALTAVSIPASIVSIGGGAFYGCRKLTAINVASGNPNYASLNGVLFDKTKTTLCECPEGKQGAYSVPDSVTGILDFAFQECIGLTSITVPDSVASIGWYAFYECSGLTSVSIGSSAAEIGNFAFNGCSSLTAINVASGNPNYASLNGVLFDKAKTTLIKYPGGKQGAYTIPASVTKIEDEAFYGCWGLKSVTIPDTVAKIGINSTFAGCSSLTEVTIPDSLTFVYHTMFEGCASLQAINASPGNPNYASVDGVLFNKDKTRLHMYPRGKKGAYSIPTSVTIIDDHAFSDCCLTGVTIPESVTHIMDYAFQYCPGLTSVTIPGSVTKIGYETFYSCSNLKSVTIPDSVTEISGTAFERCTSLTAINVASSNPNYASQNGVLFNKGKTTLIECPKGKQGSYSIPATVSEIGEEAFQNCAGLTGVTIPGSVTEIGYNAFDGCAGLKSVTIPDSVTSIGSNVFARCTGLTGVTIPNSVTVIGDSMFYGCTSLKSVTIPSSVISIGGSAFECCIGLTSMILPESVAFIEYYTFKGCSSLESVTIPGSVTSIGDYAFYGCTGLKDVYYGGTEAQWAGIEVAGGNKPLVNAVVHFNSASSAVPALAGAAASAGQITVQWDAVSGATKYAVYRKVSGGSWTLLTNTVTSTSYTDKSSDLKAGTTYYYTVRAYVGGAWGKYDTKGVSAKAEAAAASTVPVLSGATASAGQITVKWSAVSGATKYAVYRKAAGDSSWTRINNTVTGTSYTDKSSDLKAGTTYYYTVRAYVGSAWGSYDSKGVSTNAIAANYPVLTGATASAGQITVKWSAVSGATKYAVYRKAAGESSWTRINNTVTGTSYTDKSSDLKDGTVYSYTVRAYVSGAWGGYDAAGVSAKAIAAAASTDPVLIDADASAGQITVKWNAVSGATKYAVYRKAAGGNWERLANTVTGTSYTDKSSDLKDGTVYSYSVRAYVSGAWGGYDAAGVSAKAIAAAASTDPVLISADASAGQITVKWNAVSGATKYAVYRKAAGGNWERLANTVTGESYADKSADLKAGTTYYYTVRAYVNGAWGGYDTAGVSATAAASTVPVLISASPSAGQITVKWNPVSGATKYAVYRKAAGDSSWTRLSNSVTSTSYTDKSADLKAGTTYYYTVRAYVNGAWGGYDTIGVSAKAIAAATSTVPILTSATASAGQITVKWSPVSGATKYAVYRKASGDSSWTRLSNSVNSTSYTDKSADLKAGTTYYYTVRAYVGSAWGGYDTAGVGTFYNQAFEGIMYLASDIESENSVPSGAHSASGFEFIDGGEAAYYQAYIDGVSTSKVFLAPDQDEVYISDANGHTTDRLIWGFYRYSTDESGRYVISRIESNVAYSLELKRGDVNDGKLYTAHSDGVALQIEVIDVSGGSAARINSVESLEELLLEGGTAVVDYMFDTVGGSEIPAGVMYVTRIIAP